MLSHPVILTAIAVLPSIFWLVFFLFEDRKHPEPKPLISFVFIAGAVAALGALIPQLLIRLEFGLLSIDSFSLETLLIFSLIEELFKFGAVYLSVYKSKFFDEPIDAMIYMITGGLGFAALENVFFMAAAPDGKIIDILIFRFVGAVLLHALAAALIGFYWARGYLFKGVTLAVLLHTFFNYLTLHATNGLVYSIFLLLFASFFIFYDFDIIKSQPDERRNEQN